MKNQGSGRMNFALIPQLEKMAGLICECWHIWLTAQVLQLHEWYGTSGLVPWPPDHDERKKTWNQNSNWVLIPELKENDSDKAKERENSSRETAEVDSIVPSELLETAGKNESN